MSHSEEVVWTTHALMNSEDGRAFFKRQMRPLVKYLEASILIAEGGIQDQNQGRSERGMQQELPTYIPERWVQILSYTMAGRVMVTLQRGAVMLTVVFDETSKESTAGLQGIHGTEPDVRQLVYDAIAQWNARPVLVPDGDVHIAGVGKVG